MVYFMLDGPGQQPQGLKFYLGVIFIQRPATNASGPFYLDRDPWQA